MKTKHFNIMVREKNLSNLLFAIGFFILAVLSIILMFFYSLEPEKFSYVFLGTCVSIWFSVDHFIATFRQFKKYK